MFAIEIEYLRGLSVAASCDNRSQPEWPPHFDRLFSALTDTWANMGQDPDQADALRWLEKQSPPYMEAPAASYRFPVVDVYVPPNDMKVSGRPGSPIPSDYKKSLFILPALRKNRRPRSFPTAFIQNEKPYVRFIWKDLNAPDPIKDRLSGLLHSIACLGHSSSFVRVAVSPCKDLPVPQDGLKIYSPAPEGNHPFRCVYEGRFDELRSGYEKALRWNQNRRRGVKLFFRPSPSPTIFYQKSSERKESVPSSILGNEWIVLAGQKEKQPPALEAFPVIAKAMQKAILSHAEDPIPETLSGHAENFSPSKKPHLAILPLANIGWEYSDGKLLGLALALPRRDCKPGTAARRALFKALRSFREKGAALGGSAVFGSYGEWKLERGDRGMRSLDSERYLRKARIWATVTPIVLDRYPKNKPGSRAEDILIKACQNIGLPAPVSVAVYKHSSAHHGAPSSLGFRLPPGSSLRNRPFRHAILAFKEPVNGPIVLGAGRFLGLGLCLPLPKRSS